MVKKQTKHPSTSEKKQTRPDIRQDCEEEEEETKEQFVD